jgi:hypothetical protein
MDTTKLIEKRGSEYGNTWELVGQIMGILREPFYQFLHEAPSLAHNWVIMQSKMVRMLFSPYKEDHYEDLIGYATLSLEHVRKENDDGDTLSSE